MFACFHKNLIDKCVGENIFLLQQIISEKTMFCFCQLCILKDNAENDQNRECFTREALKLTNSAPASYQGSQG